MAKPRKQVSNTKKPSPNAGADKSQESELAKNHDAPFKNSARNIPKKSFTASSAPDPNETPVVAKSETTKKGGFAPALIGGILAALLGFLAARSEFLDAYLPDALKGPDIKEVVAALRASDTKQASDIMSLRAEFDATEQPDLGPIELQLTQIQKEIASLQADSVTLKARLKDLEAQFSPVNTRLDELEKRPMTDGASESAIAAYDRELATLRDAIVAQRTDVENLIAEARSAEAEARKLETNAAAAARHAEIQATVARLHATLSSGASYDQILDEITGAGITVPPVLNASASDGVASLATLVDAFPKAARAALAASRADDGDKGGLSGFLQRQLGARSVQPRDGDDPDAILSRAEAAVTDGQLARALEEVATLPDNPRAQMQDWVNIATTRLTALKAVEELAQSLNTN